MVLAACFLAIRRPPGGRDRDTISGVHAHTSEENVRHFLAFLLNPPLRIKRSDFGLQRATKGSNSKKREGGGG